jgi:glycosyltransferase involved in cell wall biosynthesis
MLEHPDVSVIIPVHNGAAHVAQAVQSVLAQTFDALELIVVDDGSTDDSLDVLAHEPDPRLRVVVQEQLGAAAARNRGVELARGSLLAFIDADDLWLPTKLSRQVTALAAEPKLDMVFGHYEEFDDESGATRAAMPGYSLGTMLVRRDAFWRVGPFATTWRVGEFIDWYGRAVDAGLTGTMRPDVVLRRRVHAGNTTRGSRQDYASVLAAMRRRRIAEAAG